MEKRPISALCLSSLRRTRTRTRTRTRLPPDSADSSSNFRPRPGLLLAFFPMEANWRSHVEHGREKEQQQTHRGRTRGKTEMLRDCHRMAWSGVKRKV